MQLVAYGAQDVYLTGNPQITFFKVVYRRHTNFAMEAVEQTFNGTAAEGKKVSCTVARNGDLLHKMYLKLTTTGAAVGAGSLDYVEVEIGGQLVDRQYGAWMAVWNGLTHTLTQTTQLTAVNTAGYVPLTFWFNRNPGLALPLIALQYHEVKLNIAFASGSGVSGAELWCDYIYLDTDERRRFAQVSHEYLIEQVQDNGTSQSGGATELRFNHPCKELVMVGDPNLTTVKLQLNGHDRMREREAAYFRDVQVYQHHSGVASAGVYVYSFALKPEEHQPSGTCNFSRIDNAVLTTGTSSAADLRVFAVNYNVLRIMSGMGGLAYSN
jgi:hypothetical protein